MALPNPEIHDLAKIDKLLDRIENEMKKKRNKNFFSSPEKYTNYMNKTTELYSLISEEVISFLDVLGLAEYMTTFQKLFRGLQQQIHSMLKFTLHYYNAKSLQVREAMITGKMPTTASGETNIKPGISFTVKIQKSNFPGQPAQSQTARDRTVSTFAGTQQPQTAANIASPYNLPDQSGIESVGNSHSGPYYLKDEHTRNFSNLPRNPYFGSPSTARSGFGSDMMSLDQDDIYETENYQHEYERIQKEIHELLESKEHIMKIQPTTLALNLKQVLRSLENTKKNTKIVIDESSDDEDIGDQQDLELMMKKLMGACSQAQKKTFQKIVDYIQNCKNQGQVLFRKDQATMPDPKMLEIDKKIMKRELEAVVQQRQQEINFLKKRVETLEQDRDLAEEKHAKLLIEHSSCEQEKKDNALQVSALEAEIASLKEIIQEGRKGRFSREPQTPLDSPVLRPAQSNAQGVSEVNKRILEQMSQYRAEIEALKLDLREERRSNMTSKLLDSNPISGLQSPARSPVKLNSQTSQPTRSMAGTPVTTKSVAKGKFVFNEKNGGKVLKEAKEVKENQENNSRDTSMSKDNRSHSQLPSRRGSVMKQENNLNLVMNSTRDGYHGESEFKKRKNNPSSGGIDVEQENRNDALEETDSYQYGQTERGENNENEMAEQQQENEMSERTMEKGENRETSTKGEVKSHNKIKRDNTAGKGAVTVKASPNGTLTKLPTGERGQSEEKSLPVNAKKNKGSEKAAPSKTAAKSSEKPSVPSLQEYGQLKKAGSKDDLTIGVDESKAKNIHVKKAPANSQQTKQNNVEKPKELAKGAGMDDDYLLKESKSTRVEKKEQTMARHDLLSSSPKKVEESRREHHSVGVDKAVQTDDIGPVSFRESRRNLSISKEVYNKPYNLVSPGYKGMNNTASGFGGQGLNLIQSDFKPSRDNSESRLASLVTKTDNKPKIGKSLMPSFEAKIKHPVSVIEDKSLMNEDSARTNKGRFQTDIDQSSERVYDDWEVHPKHYSKEDQAKIKRLTPLDKDVFMKVQMRSATSSSPVNYRESSAEPHEGDDSQINGMYKAMLAKAEQDPKILTILKTYAKERGEPMEEDTDFIPDYTLFADYLQDLRLAHQKCGENCSHLQRFYSRIGYYHFWNKRAPLTMKKPDISEEYGPKKKVPSRLPNIPEKKVLKMTS